MTMRVLIAAVGAALAVLLNTTRALKAETNAGFGSFITTSVDVEGLQMARGPTRSRSRPTSPILRR
jgi:hypothetical protein